MNKRFYQLIVILVLATMSAVFVTSAHADAPAPDKQTARYEIKFMEKLCEWYRMCNYRKNL